MILFALVDRIVSRQDPAEMRVGRHWRIRWDWFAIESEMPNQRSKSSFSVPSFQSTNID